jgi:hypothetical protein
MKVHGAGRNDEHRFHCSQVLTVPARCSSAFVPVQVWPTCPNGVASQPSFPHAFPAWIYLHIAVMAAASRQACIMSRSLRHIYIVASNRVTASILAGLSPSTHISHLRFAFPHVCSVASPASVSTGVFHPNVLLALQLFFVVNLFPVDG